MVGKNIVKCLPHCPLRIGEPRAFCISAVTHQRQYAFFADFPKTLQINGVPKHRRIIHFKVPGMHHNPRW